MFGYLLNLNKKRSDKKKLLSFYGEVYKNWESYHVMHQRGYYQSFVLTEWEKAQVNSLITLEEPLLTYHSILDEFNRKLADFVEYEKWYVADMNNKTKDNAEILHSKKNDVITYFKKIGPVVTAARDSLRAQLQRMRMILPGVR